MTATLMLWRKRLFLGGGGMLLLSLVLIGMVIVRFGYVPVDGHVLELMMWGFDAGYALYASVSLPLLGRALARAGAAR